jgi:hypothetical protein
MLMPVFETARGGRLDLALPHTRWKELEEAVDAYEKLKRERKVTNSRLAGLTREREKAIEADRRALAKAIKEGKRDPGNKAIERIEKEIQACNRRLEALEEALDDAEGDLIAVVDEHREAWVEEAEAAHLEAREAYAEAVEELSLSRTVLAERFSLYSWVKHFPDEELGTLSYRVRDSYLPGLLASWGDPYTFTDVLVALREDAQGRPDGDHAPGDPLARETQRIHEERMANEKEGRGYYTDDELLRLAEDPVAFHGGEGAERMPRRQMPTRPVNTPEGIFFPPTTDEGEDNEGGE